MKKNLLLFSASLGLLLLTSTRLFSQGFEGTIDFRKIGAVDTIQYKYYVKGNNVRIDEIGSDKHVAGTMLIDIKTETAKSLSPERKLYLDLEKGKPNTVSIDKVKIEKGKGSKKIAGYNCNEVIVKNGEQNTIVTYYLAKDNFHFLKGVIKTLNRKDKSSTYYQTISENENSFPFLSIETDYAGNRKSTLEVLNVNKQKIEDKTFALPAGFKKFEK
jgi:hypothetical protein